MPSLFTSASLRVLVLFHGAVVVDRLFAPRAGALRLDDEAEGLCVPPIGGAAAAPEVRWLAERHVELRRPGAEPVRIAPEAPFAVTEGPVEVALSVVPHFRVTPWQLGMDPLFVGALVSMVAVAVLVQGLISAAGGPPAPAAVEATPELIARLLQQDLEGADQGQLYRELSPRPEARVRLEDIQLPAGDRGPLHTPGGASERAPERRVAEAQRTRPEAHQPLRRAQPRGLQGEPVPTPLSAEAPQELAFHPPADAAPADRAQDASTALRQGFGLKDWMETSDARDKEQVQERLAIAQELVRIDPDSLWALQQLAYYQYLAEDYEGCRETYDRFIALAPEDAGGFNNLALVYKRRGEYAKEEGYYRLALAMEPDNVHVLNNLAVNLAHQGRHAEAWATMERLEQLDPQDPYADLHRAKLMAAQGRQDEALRYLEQALAGVGALDTFHHIEFRQDIRVDPAFASLRADPAFQALLMRYYGENAQGLTPGGQDG